MRKRVTKTVFESICRVIEQHLDMSGDRNAVTGIGAGTPGFVDTVINIVRDLAGQQFVNGLILKVLCLVKTSERLALLQWQWR